MVSIGDRIPDGQQLLDGLIEQWWEKGIEDFDLENVILE
jgi:hypothetical protein